MTKRPNGPEQKVKWIIGAVLWAILLLYTSSFAAAQSNNDRPTLALSKTTVSAVAVSGDTLTYVLTLTNTGKLPLAGVVVSDTTPPGTTLFGVSGPPGWVMTTPGQGRSGQVVWQAGQPMAGGEVVTLQFIVKVLPNAPGSIASDKYEARAEGRPEAVSGPPLITALVAPTPTWTPPPRPAAPLSTTPTVLPSKSPTPTLAASAARSEQVQTSPPSPVPSPGEGTISPNAAGEGGTGPVIWGGVIVLIIVLVVFLVARGRGRA